MKKILPYILIFLVVVQFFAPLTVGMGEKDKVEIKKSEIYADSLGIKMSSIPTMYNTQIKVDVNITWSEYDDIAAGTSEGVRVTIKDPSGTEQDKIKVIDLSSTKITNNQIGSYTFTGLTPNKSYNIITEARQIDMTIWSANDDLRVWWATMAPNSLGLWKMSDEMVSTTIANKGLGVLVLNDSRTTTADTQTVIVGDGKTGQNEQYTDAQLPNCSAFFWNTIGGCFGQILYWGIFQPTSVIFGLTGRLLDVSIDYSTKDTSYRSPFVLEGWKIVRDFCNLFFIFVLLYIAFGTILGLNGVKTKEMIVNVVIIGLLINFSLFTTQVIIDASNILTRVFYNSNTIKVGPKIGGVIQDQRGSMGEIKLSEAIVAKINPQKLILQASKADNIQTQQTINQDQISSTNGVSTKTFILVTILASIVNIVGLITFLMCSLIFISRVIGLWLAMILAPLVFFTYTVPQLQDMEMIGWKKWWPETIKLAFLAPIFMFFLYLIIKFLDSGLNLAINDTKGGLDFLLGVFIPFIFIMILLTKAKDIAKTMSGKMGQTITNGLAATGGLVLGGAALGTALLGRKTIGSVAKYVQNDSARQKDATTFGGYKDWSMGKKLNPFAYIGQAGKTAMAGIATGIHKIPGGKDASGNSVSLGNKMKTQDEAFSKKQNAVSSLDSKSAELATKFGREKDVKYIDLKETEQAEVREAIDKDTISKEVYGKKFGELRDVAEVNSVKDALATATKDPNNGKLTFSAQAIQRDPNDPNVFITKTINSKAGGADGGDSYANYLKTNPAVGEFVQALRRGSMDIRNISQLKSTSKGFPMVGVGLAAMIAGGVRMGLKNGPGIEHGKGQGDFMKDLSSTITDALKGVKVEVKAPSGGGHSAPAQTGGGGHH